MKRNYTFILLLLCAFASAQNINDVLRLGGEGSYGTARFQGLNGAFGALGGDLSSLNINPAGSAVFNNSLLSLTGSNYNVKNDSRYFNGSGSTSLNSLDLNQIGGVFVFKSTSNGSPWKKLALAFNYDMINNFDDDLFVTGNSDQGIDNYFLNLANGVPFGPLLIQDDEFIEEAYLDIGANLGFVDQQAFLGYYGGIIDPVDFEDDNNTDYISNAKYSNVIQDYSQTTSGYNGKFTANLATQYGDNLYLGASLNIHSVFLDKLTQLSERGFDTDSEIQSISFDNLLRTQGNGFSFSLGAIGKLTEFFRIGGSYQSPTWYNLSDETSQKIYSDLADSDISFINFNIINVFEDYTIKIPGKLTGSLAMIFGQNGLISFDYSYQDMSKAELRPGSDPSFASENDYISNTLSTVSTFRLGGEYRIEALSLRAGYRFEQSPYANGGTIGDLNGYSGGIGYNFGGSRLDLSYNYSTQDINKQLFDVGLPTPANITNKNSVVSLGYTLNF
ncbi:MULTISPECIES: OmpP1/FadL family transporter [unclassified Arenibacter]|uniref:OmpP1/FadL family transporter n=1 Tax=unclassified Arenibacter TaxID=2615047 RepID=UPI000E3466B0|nr:MULTISPECIES: outer membrane protein transport protein [unclassified Arenibacter]MCM4165136.1 aromatic hydrocarbon degradation protein [Arenibacter sp. A80]RFT55530.1 aromatic hydrocarbon degradation protein [Arenibacter sp. P308M17]